MTLLGHISFEALCTNVKHWLLNITVIKVIFRVYQNPVTWWYICVTLQVFHAHSWYTLHLLYSNPGLVVAVAQCFLQYIEGCMPQNVASQFSSVMPTSKTIQRGITFLCDYRKGQSYFCNLCKCSAINK